MDAAYELIVVNIIKYKLSPMKVKDFIVEFLINLPHDILTALIRYNGFRRSRKEIKQAVNGLPYLSVSQLKECKKYWGKYNVKYNTDWCRLFLSKYGKFDVRFIPNDIYHYYIDPYLNHKEKSPVFDDKNYYDLLFGDVLRPEVVIRTINGFFLSSSYELIHKEEAMRLCSLCSKLIFKKATNSCQGRNIMVWDNTVDGLDKLESIVSTIQYEGDYVCQKFLRQHDSLALIYAGSVNTLRINTLIVNGKVHFMAAILKMGAGKMQVDNVHWGGCSCGVNIDGTLNKYGSDVAGNSILEHPSGFKFERFRIPGFDKARNLVCALHQRIPNFRFVGWDIAINENGDPVLIEVNMSYPAIDFQQWNNGPIFGEYTDQILNEVFGHKGE